jgi:hypothetical protein
MAANLPKPIHTTGGRMRPLVRTIEEALGFIDDDLSQELKNQPRWTFARELLVVAQQSNKKRDMTVAVRQFRQALDNDGLLLKDTHEERLRGASAAARPS